jgi:hypothetical protein
MEPLMSPRPRPALHKLDKGWIGFIGGLIIPMLTMFAFYQIKFGHLNPQSFMFLTFAKKIFPPLLSLCVVVNLGLFFLFFWRNLNYAARGVIASTLVYAFLVLFMKLYYNEI